jgi:hypothetical protein
MARANRVNMLITRNTSHLMDKGGPYLMERRAVSLAPYLMERRAVSLAPYLMERRAVSLAPYLMERRAVSLARSSMRSLKIGGHIVQ